MAPQPGSRRRPRTPEAGLVVERRYARSTRKREQASEVSGQALKMAKPPGNQPSTRDLRLELGAEQVELRHLVSAASTFAALINEVTRAMTKEEGAVTWTVTIESGSVILPMKPRGEPELATALLDAIPEGIATIEREAKRPKYFTDQALTQAQHLANLASETLPIRVGGGRRSTAITKKLVAHVDILTREAQPRIGTIEGRLEEVNVHGRPTFQVWERLSGDKVLCRAGENITVDDLGEALGRRVAVRGRIRESKAGQKITIDVRQLRVFDAEEDLPTPEEVLGILRTAS